MMHYFSLSDIKLELAKVEIQHLKNERLVRKFLKQIEHLEKHFNSKHAGIHRKQRKYYDASTRRVKILTEAEFPTNGWFQKEIGGVQANLGAAIRARNATCQYKAMLSQLIKFRESGQL